MAFFVCRAARCIHAAECVSRLTAVFDTAKRPWIQPGSAPADAVAEVVAHCPTGALQYQRKDGGTAETAADSSHVVLTPNGPLYVRGDVHIQTADGATQQETRAALCRCGQSANKPFCDNAHVAAGFTAAGSMAAGEVGVAEETAASPLRITPAANGPLLLSGRFEIRSADGQTLFRGSKAALCRCGGSANKPFCDGTHKRIGFVTEVDDAD
ncbi:MAG: CDGSH iron-sulfur domain-containing protein [Anaerolineales bacterium]|nr:CDGSH iron-sulfur domain-containing protein [Anaerolineales bacterium]